MQDYPLDSCNADDIGCLIHVCCSFVMMVGDLYSERYTCDQPSQNGPSWHKIHSIKMLNILGSM